MVLGGNDPFIVLEDADLDEAVAGAMLAKMRNGGQACTAANRFLVADRVADEFARRLTERMAALTLGPGTGANTELGPMVNAAAVDAIADKVDRSVQAGAELALGGHRIDRPGFYYPATVLTEVPRDSALATEEVFGPVAPIVPVTGDDDAVAVANASELGLAAYVYTRDLSRGVRVAERLDVDRSA
jgi:succinate-semialdehyde dehydrogenase / glutarate-semialdehyde dehydrogenase